MNDILERINRKFTAPYSAAEGTVTDSKGYKVATVTSSMLNVAEVNLLAWKIADMLTASETEQRD